MDSLASNSSQGYVNMYKDALGGLNAGKRLYEAGRVFRGLPATNKVTMALDIFHGASSGLIIGGNAAQASATGMDSMFSAIGSASNVVNRVNMTKVAGIASKAAPILTHGANVVGAVMGAVEVGSGINDIRKGNTETGKEKIVSGTADIITAGALSVAAGSGGTIVGLPVAGVALGVAGTAQAVKYGYKYKDEIASGMNIAGNYIGEKASVAGNYVSEKASVAGNYIAEKATATGNMIADAAYDGAQVVKGAATTVADFAVDTGKTIVNGVADAGERIIDTAGRIGTGTRDIIYDGMKRLGIQ